ncbi:outer membrane beta-barrel protein [Chitinophaga sp. Ak27]|uniref:outer membrane beta-barrel protein n=1 Tax=Chitinophaga sp. Ak27 TaxID=2726116 RepID=UPI00145ECD01|nr:outer membrane beta-barrel protein [Chitinophaga sp. Ak27]NLU96414.1 porin family protein [Chitinophaga sp. Ak27]
MNDAFENSIRNKLNEGDIPFDQDAWTKMESLLDGKRKKRPTAWWWFVLLPILGGLSWWIVQMPKGGKQPQQTIVMEVPKENASQKTTTDKTTTTNTILANESHSSSQPGPIPGSAADSHPSATQQTTEHAGNPVTTSGKGKATTPVIHLPIPDAATRQLNQQVINPVNPHTKNPISDNAIHNPGKETINSNITDATQTIYNDIHPVKIKNVNNGNVYTKIENVHEVPINTAIPATQESKINRRKINSKGLYAGVTLGPDLNVAPSMNYGKIGFNAGVLAHYYFNKHWFVTTGAVYSKKIYGATDKDYNLPSGYPNTYGLVKVNANCDVLDIPVNANYTFLEVKNNTVSATLGISNYFMLKEKYQYIYKTLPTAEKTVENENQHYLAILNVGALYQHPAGRKLIIGVQPYAKIPLRGVGLGQVKLYSAGVSLQVNLVGKKR